MSTSCISLVASSPDSPLVGRDPPSARNGKSDVKPVPGFVPAFCAIVMNIISIRWVLQKCQPFIKEKSEMYLENE